MHGIVVIGSDPSLDPCVRTARRPCQTCIPRIVDGATYARSRRACGNGRELAAIHASAAFVAPSIVHPVTVWQGQ